MTNNEFEILLAMVENTDMGLHSLDAILQNKKVTDNEFIQMLKNHYARFEEFNTKAAQMIAQSGRPVEPKGKIAKAMSKFSIDMKIMVDPTLSHIAEMLIQGGTLGLIEAVREINAKRGNCDSEITAFADSLLHTIEEDMNAYKMYL